MSLLDVKALTKRYESPEGGPALEVLKDLDLAVSQGDLVAIVGPSGCGKSTLLNLIGALDEPTLGNVLFDGRDVTMLNEKAKAAFRNEEVGFVFQLHHLLPQCTVLENVLMPTLPAGKGNDPATIQRAEELLCQAGLKDRMSHRPGLLSGGERQRAAVVRALVNSPRLLLADEPTGSLDAESSESLAQMLLDLRQREGVTMIMVTHSPDLAALAQVTYRLENRRLTKV